MQKLVPHRSLTLPFEPFRFCLRIRGDIRNRKTTPRLGESATLRLGESGSRRLSDWESRGVDNSPTRRVGESAFECLKENLASQRAVDSPTRRAGESLWNCYWNFLKFIIKLQHCRRLNQHLKGPIKPKLSLGCNVLTPLIDLKV